MGPSSVDGPAEQDPQADAQPDLKCTQVLLEALCHSYLQSAIDGNHGILVSLTNQLLSCLHIIAVTFINHQLLSCLGITAVTFISHQLLSCLGIIAVTFTNHQLLSCLGITAVTLTK